MAYRYSIAPEFVDPIEEHINRTIDGLIGLLNARRVELLKKVRNAHKDKKAGEIAQQQMIVQLTAAQAHLQGDLREKPLQLIQERIVQEFEDKLRDLRNKMGVETKLKWECNKRDLERRISHLGKIVEVAIGVPDYGTFKTSTVATAKRGSDPGELYYPSGVAILPIHKATHQIFVANRNNNTVEIFSAAGEYLKQLGVGELDKPYGLAIHADSLYVSCWGDHTVNKYRLTNMSLVRWVGGKGSNKGQFDFPRQLTTDQIGHVFVADTNNDRISVYGAHLNYIRDITHQSIYRPYDVKVSSDRVYVLCPNTNSCMHVLTLEGMQLNTLITKGEGMDVLRPHFFCIDLLNNFVISDRDTNSIRVFSPEGNLLHTIGEEGHQKGMFNYTQGVAITPKGRLVCVSNNYNYGLQIYY
ncbi:hypothetical protein LOD99_3839 [Oopsacas minuta]|uniref:Uncharacterized protein n=1 Tax=Oopsacas minuta TaxID=111878 RepID=A0AAV7JXV7_9METZ|nr:hypothetical protein LOD99_3839 [Oopsacas minuta]